MEISILVRMYVMRMSFCPGRQAEDTRRRRKHARTERFLGVMCTCHGSASCGTDRVGLNSRTRARKASESFHPLGLTAANHSPSTEEGNSACTPWREGVRFRSSGGGLPAGKGRVDHSRAAARATLPRACLTTLTTIIPRNGYNGGVTDPHPFTLRSSHTACVSRWDSSTQSMGG